MTKVTVKIIKDGANSYFQVSWNDPQQYKHFCFKENEPADSIYNKETNRLAAMEFAHKIEIKGSETEEIIYQTPD